MNEWMNERMNKGVNIIYFYLHNLITQKNIVVTENEQQTPEITHSLSYDYDKKRKIIFLMYNVMTHRARCVCVYWGRGVRRACWARGAARPSPSPAHSPRRAPPPRSPLCRAPHCPPATESLPSALHFSNVLDTHSATDNRTVRTYVHLDSLLQ